jgi:hypothetical protein
MQRATSKKRLFVTTGIAALGFWALSAQAALVTVLPGNITGAQGADKWFRANTAGGATATVTANHLPGAGHTGAVEFNSTSNSGKVDLQYQWGSNANSSVTAAAANGYTLGNLTDLGFDWPTGWIR